MTKKEPQITKQDNNTAGKPTSKPASKPASEPASKPTGKTRPTEFKGTGPGLGSKLK